MTLTNEQAKLITARLDAALNTLSGSNQRTELLSLIRRACDMVEEPPWTNIVEGDDETLPPFNKWVLTSVRFETFSGESWNETYQLRIGGGYEWYDKSGKPVVWAFPAVVYCWQPLPEPAPYPQQTINVSSAGNQENEC
jgi:hypothetical protein